MRTPRNTALFKRPETPQNRPKRIEPWPEHGQQRAVSSSEHPTASEGHDTFRVVGGRDTGPLLAGRGGVLPECLPDRIRDQIVPEPMTGCWLWMGATNERGYGVVWWKGKRRKVHRVVFELVHGRKPRRDRELLHRCDTRACCCITRDGATHLREGTTRQNARDRQKKGRTRGCCGRIAA